MIIDQVSQHLDRFINVSIGGTIVNQDKYLLEINTNARQKEFQLHILLIIISFRFDHKRSAVIFMNKETYSTSTTFRTVIEKESVAK
jgi:hypothetical protein